MTFDALMAGRLTLIGAQRALANRVLHWDGEKFAVLDKPAGEALLVLHDAIAALDRELAWKRSQRKLHRRRAA